MSTFRVLITACSLCFGACTPEAWPGGIQARLMWSPQDGVRVVDAPTEGAAASAGLQVGDRLVAIDGRPVDGLSATQVHELLSGEVGTWVNVTVDRDGKWMPLRIERTPYRSVSGSSL